MSEEEGTAAIGYPRPTLYLSAASALALQQISTGFQARAGGEQCNFQGNSTCCQA